MLCPPESTPTRSGAKKSRDNPWTYGRLAIEDGANVVVPQATKDSEDPAWVSSACLLHEPTMADDERLASQCFRIEAGEEQRRLGNVLDRDELAIHGFLQHNVLDHFLSCNSEFLGLLGNLLVHERSADEARTNHIGANVMRRASLATTFARPIRPCLAVT